VLESEFARFMGGREPEEIGHVIDDRANGPRVEVIAFKDVKGINFLRAINKLTN
jgi:hypothetical protein